MIWRWNIPADAANRYAGLRGGQPERITTEGHTHVRMAVRRLDAPGSTWDSAVLSLRWAQGIHGQTFDFATPISLSADGGTPLVDIRGTAYIAPTITTNTASAAVVLAVELELINDPNA